MQFCRRVLWSRSKIILYSLSVRRDSPISLRPNHCCNSGTNTSCSSPSYTARSAPLVAGLHTSHLKFELSTGCQGQLRQVPRLDLYLALLSVARSLQHLSLVPFPWLLLNLGLKSKWEHSGPLGFTKHQEYRLDESIQEGPCCTRASYANRHDLEPFESSGTLREIISLRQSYWLLYQLPRLGRLLDAVVCIPALYDSRNFFSYLCLHHLRKIVGMFQTRILLIDPSVSIRRTTLQSHDIVI